LGSVIIQPYPGECTPSVDWALSCAIWPNHGIFKHDEIGL